jgi:hypothetical protein
VNLKQILYTAVAWLGLVAGVVGTGCATQGKSLALGGAIGAGAGAIAGGIADPGKDGEHRTRNVVVGSALGGVAGVVAGGLLYDAGEDKRREGYEAGKKSSTKPQAGAMPALSQPKVEARWVESKVVGNRYVEGHFEYVITEPTRWEGAE